MENSDPWSFTIIRAQGMRLMRPEKSWRPIVTVEVDSHRAYETVLGTDGQNPNLKDTFHLHHASSSSQVTLKVLHKSQSKKKAKKRILVASASHSLGELLKKQEHDPRAQLEIRLTCQSVTRPSRPTAGRGRPQNGATLILRVKPPSHFSFLPFDNDESDIEDIPANKVPELEDSGYLSSSSKTSASTTSSTSNSLPNSRSPSPHPFQSEDEDDITVVPTPTPTYAHLRRRPSAKPKRVRGYAIDSEDDVYSTSADEGGKEDSESNPLRPCFSDPELDADEGAFTYTEIVNVSSTQSSTTTRNLSGWFAPSILPSHTLAHAPTLPSYSEHGPGPSSSSSKASLPQYADTITSEAGHELQEKEEKWEEKQAKEQSGDGEKGNEEKGDEDEDGNGMNIAERILASFTSYGSLKRANLDSEYERVFEMLQTEWCFVGGLLVALAAVNTGVFTISGDSLFKVNPYARYAVASSSAFTGLGITCDAWFLFRYHWTPTHVIVTRALDVYSSYFFFSLSARLPALCMLTSACSLTAFLALVAYEAWPRGVLVTCFVWGVLVTLQFLVYGVHWLGKGVVGVGRMGRRGVGVVGRGVADAVGRTRSTIEVGKSG